MPTLRALECLVAVLEEGSFTAAAARLHLSQPALSHQVAGLERELGGPLLERATRGSLVAPTPAGRAALPHARAALAAAARAGQDARMASTGAAGELRVACAQSVTVGVLPATLRAWRRRRPGVVIHLREHASADDAAAQVRDGSADLAVVPRPTTWAAPLDVVGTEEVVLLVPADDEIAAARSTALRAVADRAWVTYDPGHGLAAMVDAACGSAGFAPHSVVRTAQTTAVPVLVEAGAGVGLVPASVVPPRWNGGVLRLEPLLARELVVLRRSREDPLARAFTDALVRRGLPLAPAVARLLDS